jgi:hypothetical protein
VTTAALVLLFIPSLLAASIPRPDPRNLQSRNRSPFRPPFPPAYERITDRVGSPPAAIPGHFKVILVSTTGDLTPHGQELLEVVLARGVGRSPGEVIERATALLEWLWRLAIAVERRLHLARAANPSAGVDLSARVTPERTADHGTFAAVSLVMEHNAIPIFAEGQSSPHARNAAAGFESVPPTFWRCDNSRRATS